MTIKIHHLRPAPGSHTAKTRVGRGQGSKGKVTAHAFSGSAREKITAAGGSVTELS